MPVPVLPWEDLLELGCSDAPLVQHARGHRRACGSQVPLQEGLERVQVSWCVHREEVPGDVTVGGERGGAHRSESEVEFMIPSSGFRVWGLGKFSRRSPAKSLLPEETGAYRSESEAVHDTDV